MTARDLITQAYLDAAILAPGESLSAADAAYGLQKLTRLLDDWNAEAAGVWADRLTTYVLTPNLNPHTIGPTSATWTQDQRPVTIDYATLVLDGSPAPHVPITLRDSAWYAALAVPTLATAIPTDLYYSADWPNGSCYFWPVPTTAYSVQLLQRIVLAALDYTDTFTMPPGYRNAVTLTLAERICPAFGQVIPPTVALEAQRARARIFANNDDSAEAGTLDRGMPKSGTGRTAFSYRSGLFNAGGGR